ncbi:MAG: hypothetical protein JXA54_06850 [Candidatus Heimdallarchaeota archaeon]|nr:hypothetical protein [Candidatus Heimdallarchaeota archaeon]
MLRIEGTFFLVSFLAISVAIGIDLLFIAPLLETPWWDALFLYPFLFGIGLLIAFIKRKLTKKYYQKKEKEHVDLHTNDIDLSQNQKNVLVIKFIDLPGMKIFTYSAIFLILIGTLLMNLIPYFMVEFSWDSFDQVWVYQALQLHSEIIYFQVLAFIFIPLLSVIGPLSFSLSRELA